MGVPSDRRAFRATLVEVRRRVRAGDTVVVACRAGLGRTGMAVACLLVDAGLAPNDAIVLTRTSRPGTIETAAQESFIRERSRRSRGRRIQKPSSGFC
jgi:protein-tyrosine phosphatase